MSSLFSKDAVKGFFKNAGQNKKKLFFILAVFAVIFFVDLRFILSAQLRAISKMGPKITKLQADLNSLDADLKKMRELKKSHGSQGTASGAKKIVSEGQIALLMERISSIANKYDVKVIQMRPQKEAPAKPAKNVKPEKFTPLSLTLDLVCDYHNLGRFISELENIDIFLQAQEIKIEPKDTDYLRQKVTLVFRTYVRE